MVRAISFVNAIQIQFLESQHPTEGRLYIRNRTRFVSSEPYTRAISSDHEFHFNPVLNFGSPANASSFMSAIIANVEYRGPPQVADDIATYAFNEVRRRGWVSGGLSIRVILLTNAVVELEGQGSEEDGGAADESLNDDEISAMVEEVNDLSQSFGSTVSLGGMSEREICRLRMEEFTGDEEEEGGECCICLEGFLEGAVITPLDPCSHRFHHFCIVPWLRNNPTCPICRRRTIVPV